MEILFLKGIPSVSNPELTHIYFAIIQLKPVNLAQGHILSVFFLAIAKDGDIASVSLL